MEKAIILQNKHWSNRKYENIYPREVLNSLLKKLNLKEIQVLLGIRRSGKSTLFKLLINFLLDKVESKSILYINLDDPYFSDIYKDSKKFYDVIETAEKITGKKVEYLFLDEIQNVYEWEKFIKSMYDVERFKKIFITGSNSTLLKSEYAKLLSGRFVIDMVYPFSFKECLKFMGISSYYEILNKKPDVLRLLDDLLKYGSFPEILKTDDSELKRELILNYYDTILLKDCIVNNNIREVKTFKELAYYLLSNNGNIYSYNKLGKIVESNENTVKNFINILEESFLLKEVKNFSYSLKAQSKARKKIYCIDNSFVNNVSFKFSENKGKLLENFVFTELLKNGYDEIYYFLNKSECDFVVKKGDEIILIQVCYELNELNKDREIKGLLEAKKKFNVNNGYILTFNNEDKIENIEIIPVWKFFGG